MIPSDAKRRPGQGRRSKTNNSSNSTTYGPALCLFCLKRATWFLYSSASATDLGCLTVPLCDTCSKQITGMVALLGGDVTTWLAAPVGANPGARPLTRREMLAGERRSATTMDDIIAKVVKS